MVKTAIYVEGGLVQSVYSTLPDGEHEIEVLDMDNVRCDTPDEEADIKTRIQEFFGSSEYHALF